MHRAEGSGVRPHAEVAKVLDVAAKSSTPEILRSRNLLSQYRVYIYNSYLSSMELGSHER